MKLPRLMPRLQKIYDIVPPCTTAADIGTDHAYIPVCLCLSGKCQSAIASDIRKGPLERALATIEEYGAASVKTRLGSGLMTVKPNEAQAIIIAGMGGILIADIIETSKETALSASKLILQPMTAVPELREYLTENGFKIEKEYLVREEEKIYTVISATVGTDRPYTKAELYMGRCLDKDGLYEDYRKIRLKKLDRQIRGLSQSENEENKKRLASLINLKEMIENENL